MHGSCDRHSLGRSKSDGCGWWVEAGVAAQYLLVEVAEGGPGFGTELVGQYTADGLIGLQGSG